MMLNASQDLWVENRAEQVSILNVVSGKELLISPADLDALEGSNSDPLPEVLRTHTTTFGTSLNRCLERFQNSAALTVTSKEPLQRLASCREYCLSKLDLSKEARRDLKALFRSVARHLREDSVRLFRYQPGLLSSMWRRPPLEYQFGQLPCMPETTQRRLEMASEHLQSDSTCLVLGDDDLMGLCWSLLYQRKCDIFELDRRLLTFYGTLDNPLISCHQRDLTKGLPQEFHGRYDIIFTDPMYDKDGMNMFFTCCSQGLSQAPHARVFLSTRPDLIQEGDKLEERLAAVGLRVLAKHQDFSRYRLPEKTRQMILNSLREVSLPRFFLRGLLKIPYYYSDLMEVARIS